jgi:hypothetical protein
MCAVLTGRLGRAGQGLSAGPAGGTDWAGGGCCASDADVIRDSVREPGRFGVIFDRYANDILRYVSARLGADLAEDVTAETFLAAFAGRGSYDFSRGSARPWLYGIAVRRSGDPKAGRPVSSAAKLQRDS